MEGTAKALGSEAALADAAKVVCQALEAAAHPYAIVRLDGECVGVNRLMNEWAQPAGLAGQLVGRSLAKKDDGAVAAALAKVSLGEATRLEVSEVPLVGSRRGRYRLHLSPFRIGSMVCAAVVTFQDLTEQKLTAEAFKASERRFRLLVDSAADGIGVHRGGILLYVNPAAVRLLGYSAADEVIGRPIMDFVHPNHHDKVRSHIAELAHAGSAPVREETFVRQDGSAVQVELSASRATLDDGVADFVFLRDVSARARQQLELDRANRIESLSRFAGTVAHDINNLLAGIQGHLAMARLQSRQPEALAAAFGSAQREIERAADLTQQLLTFSRGADIPVTVLDPNEVVAEVVGALERVPDGQVVVETELDPAVGMVRMAAAQLNQIVLNLLLNAREAVRGGGWVQVRTDRRSVEARAAWPPERVGDWVVISVTDTGVGMDNATRARIFEPFFTTKRAGQGAGLGLSTVYGLVRQAGGWIDVESEYGKGTRFEIYLPAHEGEDDVARADVMDPQSSPENAGGETVLVCDDEARLAMLTAGLLDQYGYAAVTVTSCEEALTALGSQASGCDVILLDVNLPDGTAGEVLQQMRNRGYQQPVILTSGYAEEDVPPEIIADAQVAGYLAKPYSVDRLVGAIRRALDRGAG